MGGIPTNLDGLCLSDGNGGTVEGLYAAGEQACVSLHGANRLGTNSLGDLVVFGRRAGIAAAAYARQVEYAELPDHPQRESLDLFDRLRASKGTDNAAAIRKELQESMMNNVGIYRNGPDMEKQVGIIQELKSRYQNVGVSDPSKRFNSDLVEAMELGFLLDCAEAMTASAVNRTESRGGHDREDFHERDDANWLKHTMAYKDLSKDGNVIIGYKPVALKGFTRSFEPKPRVY